MNRNGIIIGYKIQYGERNIISLLTINTNSSATTHLISDLNPFTEYTFTVAGVNRVGTGPFSAASNIIRTEEESK